LGGGKVRVVYEFKDLSVVVIFCRKICECNQSCSVYRRYVKQEYNVICLNPKFYNKNKVNEILSGELEKIRNMNIPVNLRRIA